MQTITYRATTNRGNVLLLDKHGCVMYWSDNGLDKRNANENELKSWIITGIYEVMPFGRLGHYTKLQDAINIKDYSFNNGKPKYRIADLDHGTHRIWGNESLCTLELSD